MRDASAVLDCTCSRVVNLLLSNNTANSWWVLIICVRVRSTLLHCHGVCVCEVQSFSEGHVETWATAEQGPLSQYQQKLNMTMLLTTTPKRSQLHTWHKLYKKNPPNNNIKRECLSERPVWVLELWISPPLLVYSWELGLASVSDSPSTSSLHSFLRLNPKFFQPCSHSVLCLANSWVFPLPGLVLGQCNQWSHLGQCNVWLRLWSDCWF